MVTRPSMGRRPITGYDEQDVYTGWRRLYCYTRKAGVVAYVKKKTHKRERREARAQIKKELNA